MNDEDDFCLFIVGFWFAIFTLGLIVSVAMVMCTTAPAPILFSLVLSATIACLFTGGMIVIGAIKSIWFRR